MQKYKPKTKENVPFVTTVQNKNVTLQKNMFYGFERFVFMSDMQAYTFR